MEKIPTPQKISVENLDGKYKAKIVIDPLYPGYGNTLGNALRRVLLSSLPGAAVTSVKIKGVQHEFSNLDHVVEDVVDIILNLKQLRPRVYSEEPVKIRLKAKGEREVTAADIETDSDVEIGNKDLHIATLTDPKAELDMEITVAAGRGYIPTENRDKEKMEVDSILVDAVYTPVKNVGFKVEATRVGQRTDYDRLILEVETDGTILPLDAIKESSKLLIEQFIWLDENIESKEEIKKAKKESAEESEEESEDEEKPKKKKKSKKEE